MTCPILSTVFGTSLKLVFMSALETISIDMDICVFYYMAFLHPEFWLVKPTVNQNVFGPQSVFLCIQTSKHLLQINLLMLIKWNVQ